MLPGMRDLGVWLGMSVAILWIVPSGVPAAASADGATSRLSVAPADQACRTDTDCVVVGDDCGGCSCGVPVSRARAVVYAQRQRTACASYHGPHCDYACPTPTPACRDGRCVMVGPDAAQEGLPAAWAMLFEEADLIAAVRVISVDATAAAVDGPVYVDAAMLKSLGPAEASARTVRFGASAWMGPAYQPNEQRIVFLQRIPDGHAYYHARWAALEPGRIDLFVDNEQLPRLTEASLRAFLRRVSAGAFPPPNVRFEPVQSSDPPHEP